MSAARESLGIRPMQPRPTALTADAIAARLQQLPLWSLHGTGKALALTRTFHFEHYLQVIAFVNAVAWMAEQQNHHPSLQVHYRCCTVHWNTHDAAGLTLLDFDCAERTDALVNL